MKILIAIACLFVAATAFAERFEKGGIAVDFTLTPVEGKLAGGSTAVASFRRS